MDRLIILGFLYFPEDKSGYFPAAIQFLILIILCIAVFMWIKRFSKKEEQKTKALEEYVLNKQKQESQDK